MALLFSFFTNGVNVIRTACSALTVLPVEYCIGYSNMLHVQVIVAVLYDHHFTVSRHVGGRSVHGVWTLREGFRSSESATV